MKHETTFKKLLAAGLAAAMLLSTGATAFAEDAQNDAMDELIAIMKESAVETVKNQGDSGDLYPNMEWTSVADTLPASFDLRSRGVVPEVRNQQSWGTCWGFASIAASEISILSKLGLTTEEYKELYGKEMDLSEKHLAWFATNHLPALDAYPEGEYLYAGNENQAGEGIWYADEETDANSVHYRFGGMMGFASSSFANGIGPASEEDYPYAAADGSTSTAGDWTLQESDRFNSAYALDHSRFLPSPSGRDEDGNYVYNAAGTEAIKEELLAGRAVTIAYHADQAMSPDAMYNIYHDYLIAAGFSEEDSDIYAKLAVGMLAVEDATRDQWKRYFYVYLVLHGTDSADITDELLEECVDAMYDEGDEAAEDENTEDTEENDGPTDEQIELARQAGEEVGWDYDEYVAQQQLVDEANAVQYINTDTYAQYTDSVYATPTHAVTIIGWDDNYSVSNFPADHQPPADGAWIVRNSWGDDYGIDGYFYLSYYDQTICEPETFDFVTEEEETAPYTIEAYDMMETGSVSSIEMDSPVFLANVFETDEDDVLSYVSIMTGGHNAKVTTAVYLLGEDAASPTDGILLDTVTDTYEYAGYHRIKLNQNYLLAAGTRISVVTLQRAETTDGVKYAVPFAFGTTQDYSELFNTFEIGTDSHCWQVGCIGEGESFIRVGEVWYDWADIIAAVQEDSACASLLTYDNLSLKAYLYPLDDILSNHSFGDDVPWYNGTAALCEDCGYTLIYIGG